MITIIVDTKDEYDEMMQDAQNYVCRKMPGGSCQGYMTHRCEECFELYHIEYGIRIIPPVDNLPSDNL